MFNSLTTILLFFIYCESDQTDVFVKRETTEEQEVQWWKDKANNMVISQIERRNIQNPLVLKVMRDIPRHSFISSELKDVAYSARNKLKTHGYGKVGRWISGLD